MKRGEETRVPSPQFVPVRGVRPAPRRAVASAIGCSFPRPSGFVTRTTGLLLETRGHTARVADLRVPAKGYLLGGDGDATGLLSQ